MNDYQDNHNLMSEKQAAARQDAIGLRHQRADPAHVEIAPAHARGPGQALIEVTPHGRAPVTPCSNGR